MASNAEQDQLKKANQNMQAPVSDPQAGQANSSRVASYSAGNSTAAPTQSSGRFTNLKNYVNANQGAGDQLGSRITGNIDKNLDKTQKEATTATGNIANNIQAEKDRLAKGTGYNAQLQDQNQDGASTIYNNTDDKANFGKLLNNQNVAGNLAANTQTAADTSAAGLNNVNSQINNLGSEAGRFNLLQQAVKSPNYTNGQQRLDQLMLQAGNPNQLVSSQRDLTGKLTGVQNNLSDTYKGLDTGINEAGTQADEISKLLNGTLGTQTQNLIKSQADQATGLNTSNANANTALQTYFTNGYGSLTPEQKAAIDPMLASGGLTTGMRTYNVLKDPQSFQNYVTNGSTNLTQKDVLDQNEFNRYQALAGLAGTDPTQQVFTGAGTGGINAGIQGDKLNTDVTTARSALENQLNRTTNSDTTNNLTYSSNLLDLLKYQEDPSKATALSTAYGNGTVTPITGTFGGFDPSTINQVVGSYKNPALSSTANSPGLGNLGATYSTNPNTVASSQATAALQAYLDKYYGELNTAGYNNTLGQFR